MDSNDSVIRGGSWISDARSCRSAYRFRFEPDFRSDYLGFRVIKRSAKENDRVLRGGSWLFGWRDLRSADRFAFPPDYRDRNFGLRVIRTKERKV